MADKGGEFEGGRRHRGSKKSRRSRKGTRKQSKWMQHVMATKRANKGKDLSEVLVIASKTYKKGGMEGGFTTSAGPGIETVAAVGGGKKTRKSKKSRSRKH